MPGDELVPITREFLRKHYSDYPIRENAPEWETINSTLDKLCEGFERSHPGEMKDIQSYLRALNPKKIDETLFRIREMLEEVQDSLKDECVARLAENGEKGKDALCSRMCQIRSIAKECFSIVESLQQKNVDRVTGIVQKFMPNDFRLKMLTWKRERGERHMAREVDRLMQRGGTVRDKYDLLWKHQVSRREQLVQIGQASGMFKVLLKLLAGIPQVLLNFIQTINDDEGPLEEARVRYAPFGYTIIHTMHKIAIVLRAAVRCGSAPEEEETQDPRDLSALLEKISGLEIRDTPSLESVLDACEAGLLLSRSELEYYSSFLSNLFDESPFFITAREAAQSMSTASSFCEHVIAPRSKFSETIAVNNRGAVCGWEFQTEKADIGFSVYFQRPTGEKLERVQYKRVESHKQTISGNIEAKEPGVFIFEWDNSYSLMSRKHLTFRLDVMEDPAMAGTASEGSFSEWSDSDRAPSPLPTEADPCDA